jgi:hypothetical protein
MLHTPLSKDDIAELQKEERPNMPVAYERWNNAQLYSAKAADLHESYQGVCFPLSKTKKVKNLEEVWKQINRVSAASCVLMFC